MSPTSFSTSVPFTGSSNLSAPVEVTLVRGLAAVLERAPELVRLADRSGQRGAADFLEYFLTGPYVGPKTPCLLMLEGADGETVGSVLLYEYRLKWGKLGVNTRVYITDDEGGDRTVLGRLEARACIAAAAVDHLLRRQRARLVLLTLRAEVRDLATAMEERACHRPRGVALRERVLRRWLPLAKTYDATLAQMGKHTRRNLRYYERRATLEAEARFVANAPLTKDDCVALNRRCSYPVPDAVAAWRYRTARELPGGYLVGLQTGAGEWISVLGGRRHHGTTEIAWQMNRTDFEPLSPSTVMRSHLLRYEVERGTERLFFEGGTPHSMRAAFEPEPITDLLAWRRSPGATLVRMLAPRVLPDGNFLKDLLRDPTLKTVPSQGKHERST